MEKLLSARMPFPFLLSPIHIEVYLVVTPLILNMTVLQGHNTVRRHHFVAQREGHLFTYKAQILQS